MITSQVSLPELYYTICSKRGIPVYLMRIVHAFYFGKSEMGRNSSIYTFLENKQNSDKSQLFIREEAFCKVILTSSVPLRNALV